MYTTWNILGETATVLSPSAYTMNFIALDYETYGGWFIGVKLNSTTNAIEKAYACGKKETLNDDTYFCLEGYYDDSKLQSNINVLNASNLWNGSCELDETFGASCGDANIDEYGAVFIGDSSGGCGVDADGSVYCE